MYPKQQNWEAMYSLEGPKNDLHHPEFITLLNIVMNSGDGGHS